MSKIEWHLEARKLSNLKFNPKNPRRLSRNAAAHLTISLEKFGLSEKPIINLDDQIIGGHQRVKLLKKLRYTNVECWVPNRMLEETEVEELLIRLNKNNGEFDDDMLANEFDALNLLEWGFSENELLGLDIDLDEGEKKKKEKKIQTCPKCGEEFST